MKRFSPCRFAARRGKSAGYNLVILVMAITTLNILVAMALPVWSHMIRREKEAQLIFRGLQYAEALRVYKVRHGGYPTQLNDLIKVEPRCIRQLWDNPFGGTWTLILTPVGGGTEVNPPINPPDRPGDQGRFQQSQTQVMVEFDPKNPESQVVQGPIFGVFSSEGGEAVKMWNNSSNIADWQFRAELLNPVAPPPGAENPQPVPVNAARVGRPFPPGVTPLTQPVGGPGLVGGDPGQGGRGGLGATGSGVGGINLGGGGRPGQGGGRPDGGTGQGGGLLDGSSKNDG